MEIENYKELESYEILALGYEDLNLLPTLESMNKSKTAAREKHYNPNVKSVLGRTGKLEALSVTDIE